MNALGRYKETRGLSYEQVADELSALLGKPIKAKGVQLRSGTAKVPPAWADALGLDLDVSPADDWVLSDDEAADEPRRRVESDPPKAPSGAPIRTGAPLASSDYAAVRERIAQAYGAMGAGFSMVTHNDGYSEVSKFYGTNLADAWVAAAKENKHVAQIVAFMESGGPVGELVVAHVILVLGFVYVSGRAESLGFLYGKFEPYHRKAAAELVVAAAEAETEHFHGTDPRSAAHPMGEPDPASRS